MPASGKAAITLVKNVKGRGLDQVLVKEVSRAVRVRGATAIAEYERAKENAGKREFAGVNR